MSQQGGMTDARGHIHPLSRNVLANNIQPAESSYLKVGPGRVKDRTKDMEVPLFVVPKN